MHKPKESLKLNGVPKWCENSKIESDAGSVWLSLFMDRSRASAIYHLCP